MWYNGCMKYRCVIFDLDGTLVDTLEDIALAMNQSLAEGGFPQVPLEEYPHMVGWGITKLAGLALPPSERGDEKIRETAARAQRLYAETPLLRSKPYPGMAELVAELGRIKIRAAVLTNKPDPVARKVVEGLFPRTAFAAIRGALPGAPLKPDPAAVWEILTELDCTPGQTIFAGDSEIDIETARAAGCFPLGVSWGYRPRNVLEEAGAPLIIDEPDTILSLIRDTHF
jgi:phosphoglycolate phosphatase